MEDKGNTSSAAVEAADSSPSPTKKAPKAKGKTTKASHPPTSEMVNAAIKELKDRKGSSLQAIKKYIVSTYKVDGERLAPFVKRYLKAAVSSGTVVQTKGKGASGSFKLSGTKSSDAKPKVQRTPKSPDAKKPKKASVEKKTSPARKPAATKKSSPKKKKPAEGSKKSTTSKKAPSKPAAAEKAKAAAEPKVVSKAKKTAKAPAAKTKTPKPKKAATAKAVTAKAVKGASKK